MRWEMNGYLIDEQTDQLLKNKQERVKRVNKNIF